MTDQSSDNRIALVIMGVSGSGKTSVGALLAGLLDLDFVDGDDLHPARNVEKMHAGHPLDDDDRAPWLDRVGATLGNREAHPGGVAMACSALKRSYRDRIRAAAGPGLIFVFLDVDQAEVERRMAVRLNHFMPASLVDSQFGTLERPDGEPDVIFVWEVGDANGTARTVAERLKQRFIESGRPS